MTTFEIELPVPATEPDTGNFDYPEFGNAWTPVIIGLLNELKRDGLWDNPPEDINAQIDELIERLITPVTIPQPVYPNAVTLLGDARQVLAGNALIRVNNAAKLFGTSWYQSPATSGDVTYFKVALAAGDYNLKIVTEKGPNSAVFRIAKEGISVMDVDLYSAAVAYQFTIDYTFGMAADGIAEFVLSPFGKNPSSSGYYIQISLMTITEL